MHRAQFLEEPLVLSKGLGHSARQRPGRQTAQLPPADAGCPKLLRCLGELLMKAGITGDRGELWGLDVPKRLFGEKRLRSGRDLPAAEGQALHQRAE